MKKIIIAICFLFAINSFVFTQENQNENCWYKTELRSALTEGRVIIYCQKDIGNEFTLEFYTKDKVLIEGMKIKINGAVIIKKETYEKLKNNSFI